MNKRGRALVVTGYLAEVAMREHNASAKSIDHLTEYVPVLRGVFRGSLHLFAQVVGDCPVSPKTFFKHNDQVQLTTKRSDFCGKMVRSDCHKRRVALWVSLERFDTH